MAVKHDLAGITLKISRTPKRTASGISALRNNSKGSKPATATVTPTE
jgi:hypothetical protein